MSIKAEYSSQKTEVRRIKEQTKREGAKKKQS